MSDMRTMNAALDHIIELKNEREGLKDTICDQVDRIITLEHEVAELKAEGRRLLFRPSVFDAAINDRWPDHE